MHLLSKLNAGLELAPSFTVLKSTALRKLKGWENYERIVAGKVGRASKGHRHVGNYNIISIRTS